MQIIVLGAPRSGASLITRLLHLMGASFDSGPASIGFRNEGVKGFWEHSDVVAINDRLLEAQGCRWDRLAEWNPDRLKGKDEETAKEIARIVASLDVKQPWVLKDPRLCLTFPAWKAHLSKPVLIIVGREPLETARSLQARDGYSLAHGLALWEYYALGSLMAAEGMPAVHVGHRELMTDPAGLAQRLKKELFEKGVSDLRLPDEKEMQAFIDTSMHRSKTEEGDEQLLNGRQNALAAALVGRNRDALPARSPSLLARDTMATAGRQLAAEERLRAANENFALSDQDKHALQSELQHYRQQSEAELTQLRSKLDQYRDHVRAINASTSWQLGHKLVKLGRLLTFQWRKTETRLPG